MKKQKFALYFGNRGFMPAELIEGARDEYDDVLKIICSMQTTNIQPVKQGRWLNQTEFCKKSGYVASGIVSYYWCSCCGKAEKKLSDYCPNCGARMNLGGELHNEATDN